MAEIRARLKHIRDMFDEDDMMFRWIYELWLFAISPVRLDTNKKKDDKVKKLHNKTRKG
jgi:hypothetical protein